MNWKPTLNTNELILAISAIDYYKRTVLKDFEGAATIKDDKELIQWYRDQQTRAEKLIKKLDACNCKTK